VLTVQGTIPIPPYAASEFDHGDVEWDSGRVFIAHTQAGTVEVVDAIQRQHQLTIAGCAEASGVLVAQAAGFVFAAARGAGQVLVIEADSGEILRTIPVDPRPNGLAWDDTRQHLLVADVQANTARLVTPLGDLLSSTALPGRPRWCVFDAARDHFLVNIREPACVAVLAADTGAVVSQWAIPSAGPHGLDLDGALGHAFVACDGGQVVRIALADGHVLGMAALAGVPDAIWLNAARHQLYVAIGDPGVVQVVATLAMQVIQTIVTEPGAHTTAFDPQRQVLYVFLPDSCQAGIYAVTDEGDQQ
jgi:DNA-binding beta-propeller fold protein YncE